MLLLLLPPLLLLLLLLQLRNKQRLSPAQVKAYLTKLGLRMAALTTFSRQASGVHHQPIIIIAIKVHRVYRTCTVPSMSSSSSKSHKI